MHLVTQSLLLKALGWTLFNSLWQMAILWLMYILLASVFSKANAHSRHRLAAGLLSLGVLWSLLDLISVYTSPANNTAIYTWFTGLPVAKRSVMLLLPYCSFIYLLSLGFLFVRYFRMYQYCRKLKTSGLSRIDPSLRVFVIETARRMGISKNVNVWLSSLVEEPLTLGFLRPIILIPFATINNLTLSQVEAILLHELAHIKRYDYLLNLGVTIAGILFFFNPFTRLLIRDIKREREHRCDDLVMQFRYDPHSYASALLSLATVSQGRQTLALAATGRNERMLLQRVKRILRQESSPVRPGNRTLVVLLFTLLTAFIGFSRSDNPQRGPGYHQEILAVRYYNLSGQKWASNAIDIPVVEGRSGRQPATRRVQMVITRSTAALAKGQDSPIVVVQTSYNEDNSATDEDSLGSLVSTTNGVTTKSDYSITRTETADGPPTPTAMNKVLPYVPESSFVILDQADSNSEDLAGCDWDQLGKLKALLGKVPAVKFKKEVLIELVANDRLQNALQKELDSDMQSIQALDGRIMAASGQTPDQTDNLRRRTLEQQLQSYQVNLLKLQDIHRSLTILGKKLQIVHI